MKVKFRIGYRQFAKGSVHDLGGSGEQYVRRGVAVPFPDNPGTTEIETASLEPVVERADATPKRRRRSQ
jgi:hypothetical protein